MWPRRHLFFGHCQGLWMCLGLTHLYMNNCFILQSLLVGKEYNHFCARRIHAVAFVGQSKVCVTQNPRFYQIYIIFRQKSTICVLLFYFILFYFNLLCFTLFLLCSLELQALLMNQLTVKVLYCIY